VLNKEMGRGYQINVERGFDELVASNPTATLLGLMNRLDKALEQFLSAPKADTVTLVSHSGANALVSQQSRIALPAEQASVQQQDSVSVPEHTAAQKQQAQAKREADIRQLDARLGKLPLYEKYADGVSFRIPIEPRKRSGLHVSIQAIKHVKLIVPVLYNLCPCRIELEGAGGDNARNVEKAFERRATKESETSLLGHINYLSQNMHTMANEAPVDETAHPAIPKLEEDQFALIHTATNAPEKDEFGYDRSHIKLIPRPPEWMAGGDSSDDESDLTPSDSDMSEAEEGDGEKVVGGSQPAGTAERGVMLSFPYVEMHGIELLELTSLCITIKCLRCKDQMDVTNIRNNVNGDSTGMRSVSCKKCTTSMEVGYRMDLMHANSVRAGYLDLEGCTVVDMLPR
jgi:hypothetical protein